MILSCTGAFLENIQLRKTTHLGYSHGYDGGEQIDINMSCRGLLMPRRILPSANNNRLCGPVEQHCCELRQSCRTISMSHDNTEWLTDHDEKS